MKKITLLTCFSLFLFNLKAQEVFPKGKNLSRAFLDFVPELEIAFPIGEFHEKMERNALVGKGMGIFYRFKKQPVDAGFRFSGLTYDKTSQTYSDTLDGQEQDILQKNKNKIWLLHGVIRFEPPVKFPVQPYFEGSAGFHRFFTKTFSKKKGLSFSSDEDDSDVNARFDRETLHSDWGRSFSGAVGLRIFLEQRYRTALDFRVGYTQGVSNAFYVRNDSQEILPDPLDNYVRKRAPLSTISVKIAVSLLGYK